MAIEYARVNMVGKSKGKNACEKAAYNGNCKIKDLKINCTFNLSYLTSNIYHEIVLPEYVNAKFKDVEILMNEVERCERRKDSQLLREYLLALPGEEEITLEHKIKLTKLFIEKLELTKNGLGVVIDIHKPVEDEINWYAKLLVTTRRFDESGEYLGEKARDLELQIRRTKWKPFVLPDSSPTPGSSWREVQNNYFKELGLDLRVKEVSEESEGHIGVRKYGVIAEQRRLDKKQKKKLVE